MIDFHNFNHFSGKVITKVRDGKNNATNDLKPNGLWFCRGYEWTDWCRNVGFATQNYIYRYPIKRIDDSNILIVDSILEGITNFCQKYAGYGGISVRLDWDKIISKYDGIYLPHPNHKIKGDLFSVPGATLFFSLDVDSLIIFKSRIIMLDQAEYKPEGWLDEEESQSD